MFLDNYFESEFIDLNNIFMIKLIIFDLWKTLAYRDVPEGSAKTMLRVTNSKIPYPEFVKIFENSLQTKKWKSKFDAYANLCKNMNLPVTEENVQLLMSIRDEAESKTKEFEHTNSMLRQLKDAWYKIWLISNCSVFALEHVKEKTSILNYIDYPLFSFDVWTIKPDLKIFVKMLEISWFKPEESIMIGDNMWDDVLPPREIWMNSCLFKNYEQLKEDLLEYSIVLK